MRSNDVAKLAGVTVRTLRHYHQLGLLSEPPRRANGYRDYSPADVARVLRIKRLAALGFPLSRIGDVLEEMDAEEHATSASALDELDRELALEIARLQEQRRTIAELRAEHLDPDLPVRFARILRKLAGVDSLAETSPDDRTALIVAAHLYDEKELGELERVVDTIASERLVEAMERLEEWDDMLVRGEIPGVSVGEVVVGRPLKFGEHLRLVGFKETEQKIERMDKRADSLGMKRSDYLRWLVDKDLASVDVA